MPCRTVTDTSTQSVISGVTIALRDIVRVCHRAGPAVPIPAMYAVQSNRLSERLNEATAGDRAVRRLAWMPYDPAVLLGC